MEDLLHLRSCILESVTKKCGDWISSGSNSTSYNFKQDRNNRRNNYRGDRECVLNQEKYIIKTNKDVSLFYDGKKKTKLEVGRKLYGNDTDMSSSIEHKEPEGKPNDKENKNADNESPLVGDDKPIHKAMMKESSPRGGSDDLIKGDSKKETSQMSVFRVNACKCQELSPEQIKEGIDPPPCNCKAKHHQEKKRRPRVKGSDCPECERIKLNANLIRAIKRINELQAKQCLTEFDVKQILEEEYKGDIFGYKAQTGKKTVPDINKKIEVKQKTINEREQEMREEFKDLITSEVIKFEEKNKMPAPKQVTASKEISEFKPEKVKRKRRKRKNKIIPPEVEEILKWMYPNHYVGHKFCLPPLKLVPKTMGWLWNSSKGAGILKVSVRNM